MTVKLLVFLVIGTIAMGIPLLNMAKCYGISKTKIMILTVMLTITGTVGTFMMYYVENQKWGGLSFYGAVFIVPIVFITVSAVLKIPYNQTMDFCAVGECIMLALMKVHCMIGGCCLGRILFELPTGEEIRFPSRLFEMAVAVILFMILYRCSKKENKIGKLYPMYMLLYGITRFGLNILREAWANRERFLPYGNTWSLVACLIGTVWLVAVLKEDKDELKKNKINE